MSAVPAPLRFAVLVPVKPPAHGKSRLRELPDEMRTGLAAAFARDTVTAVLAAELVAQVMVVTDDHELARSLRELDCAVLPDGVTGDLNASLVQAAHEAVRRWPDLALAAVCADLPALRPEDLDTALAAVPPSSAAFVADEAGSGTTMYAAPDADRFRPGFGRDSRSGHRAAGAVEISGSLPTLRADVDEPGDLGRAMLLGVGPHTAAITGGR